MRTCPSERPVTGSMLRDLVVCEHRPWLDVHGDADARAPVASFVELLWSGGMAHEATVLDALPGVVADLRRLPAADRAHGTLRAMEGGADHILGAEIVSGDLLGRPDILSRVDGLWRAGDVKAGSPFMPDGRRPKLEYAAQVGLYARILGERGLGDPSRAFVIGSDGEPAWYDLMAPSRDGCLADRVDGLIAQARGIVAGTVATMPASGALCGLCHWRNVCAARLEAEDDVTLIAGLGRAMRTTMSTLASTRAGLAALDLEALRRERGDRIVPGLGADRLGRFRDRAVLATTPGAAAYAREPIDLPVPPIEWHLDIEADPTRGPFVYLHGIWERAAAPFGGWRERFVHFFADDADGEEAAFAAAWSFLTSDPEAVTYYYSPYERTSYRMLQRRFPAVCTADEVDGFFASDRVIDLYSDVVAKKSEWPLQSYGLKAIAKSRGFRWKAADAGGAASIAWFDEWCRTGDPAVRDRIIDYNRSDVMASAVVLDALRELPPRPSPR